MRRPIDDAIRCATCRTCASLRNWNLVSSSLPWRSTINHVRAVDQNVGDGIVPQQRARAAQAPPCRRQSGSRERPDHGDSAALLRSFAMCETVSWNSDPQFFRAEPYGDDGLDLHQNFIANGISSGRLRSNEVHSRPGNLRRNRGQWPRVLSEPRDRRTFFAEIVHDHPNSRLSSDRGGSSASPTS